MLALPCILVIVSVPAAPTPEKLSALVEQLKSGGPGERVIAAELLGDLGPAAEGAIPMLAAAVRNTKPYPENYRPRRKLPTPGTREHASRFLFFAARDSLVRIGPKAADALGELLTHEDEEARQKVAEALQFLGPDAKSAVPALIKAIDDPNVEVRIRVLMALAAIGPAAESAIPEVLKAALQPTGGTRAWLVQESAVKVLVAIGPKASPILLEKVLPSVCKEIEVGTSGIFTIRTLVEALGEKAAPMVEVIVPVIRSRDRKPGTDPDARTLLHLGPSGLKACETLLAEEPKIRRRVLEGLQSGQGEELIPLIPPLLALLKREDRQTQLTVVQVLGGLREKATPEVIDAVATMMDDPKFLPLKRDEFVQYDAIRFAETMIRFGPPAVPKLLRLLKSQSPAGRAAAARALRKFREPGQAALPVLRTTSDDPFLLPALEASESAAWISLDPKDLTPLIARLRDPSPEVRLNVLERLGATTPLLAPHQKELVALLDDPDKEIRRKATGLIVSLGSATPVAVDALARRLPTQFKEGGFWFPGQHPRLGPSGKPAVPSLIKFLDTNSSFEFDEVCDLLAGIGFEAADAVPALTQRLENLGDWRPKYLLFALGTMGAAGKPAVPQILKVLNADNDETRLAAALCLGAIGPAAKAAIPDLKTLLTDPNPEIRLVVTSSIARITGDSVAWRSNFERVLRTRPAGSGPKDLSGIVPPIINPFEWLAPNCPELLPVAIRLLPEMSIGMRKGTVIGIGKFGPAAAEAAPALLKLLRDERSWPSRIEICEALAAIGPSAKVALPTLRELLANEYLDLALAARDAIHKIEEGK